MQEKKWSGLQKEIIRNIYNNDPGHSDAIVAVDSFGNVAAVIHSINTGLWGTTGIVVEGITIPDSACFQQEAIKMAGPGNYLPNRTNPVLVFKNNKCIIASSSVGNGLHEVSLQNLFNLMDAGMPIAQSVNTANFYTPDWDQLERQTTLKGAFSKKILKQVKRMGQPVKAYHEADAGLLTGTWIGLTINEKTGEINGAIPGDNLIYRAGHAQGF